MRALLFLVQLAVFVPMLLGINQSFRLVLGPTLWPGLPGAAWAFAGGALLALIVSVLTEIEMRKCARREALRMGCLRRL